MNLNTPPQPPPPPTRGRLVEVDALRGLAILYVLANHFVTRFHQIYGLPTEPLFTIPQDHVGPHAMFIVSGFIAATTLPRARSARDYALARLIRLAPTFWAGAILTFTVVRIFRLPGREISVREAYINLTMVPSLFGARPIDGAYWTLEIQLAFFALAAVALALNSARQLWLLVAAITTFHLAATQSLLPDSPHAEAALHPAFASTLSTAADLSQHAAFFLIGIVIALMRDYPPLKPKWWHLALLALAFTDIALPRDNQAVLIIVATAALTYLAVNFRVASRVGQLFLAPFALVGTISYALYVVNQNIGFLVMRAAFAHHLSTATGIALATLTTLALAIAITFLIERPANSLLRRKLLNRNQPTSS